MRPPGRYGNAHPNIVPYESFPTNDGYVALAVGSDRQFERFCQVAESPELWQDERFRTNAGRVEYRQELVAKLRQLTRQRTTQAWLDLLLDAGIPAGPINDIPTTLNDPQVAAREMVQEVEHAAAGTIKLLGPVAKLSRTPARIRFAPPVLGSGTEDVLAQLGYTAAETAALREAGVI